MNLAKNGAEMSIVGSYSRMPLRSLDLIDSTGTFSFTLAGDFAVLDDREPCILKGINENDKRHEKASRSEQEDKYFFWGLPHVFAASTVYEIINTTNQ